MKKKSYLYLIIAFLFLTIPAFADNPDLQKKADRIHGKYVTIDSHNDTPLRMLQTGFDMAKRHNPKTERSRVDFIRMEEGGLDGAFFAVFVSQGKRTPEGTRVARERAMSVFDTIYNVVERNQSLAGIAISSGDAYRLKREGKRAVYLGVENGYPVGKDLFMVDTLHKKGARYITLVHTRNNDICDSSTDTLEHGGLSSFGYEVVRRMNRIGMMVDISHASDSAFYDILEVSSSPVIASHSCARALCDNPRNLDDRMLKALAKNGGVIQMCILSDYVKTPDPNPARDSARAALRVKFRNFDGLTDEEMKEARKEWYALEEDFPQKLATVSDVADHIDHIVKIAGISHVGIGTDFDGGGGVTGCYDVSEMKNITVELLRRGYSEKEIALIWGGNLLRVMKEAEEVAKNANH